MRLLLIDNYDSFTFNLFQMLRTFGAEVDVRRNDALDPNFVAHSRPDAIVISPGPGHPESPKDFGVCAEILRYVSKETPTLGVCLGHQGIAHHFGAKVIRSRVIMHGKTSLINHFGGTLYEGVPTPFLAGRYHSLIVDGNSIPHELKVTAITPAGEVMGLRHERYPIEGVQYHPESILTPHGRTIIANFLREARR